MYANIGSCTVKRGSAPLGYLITQPHSIHPEAETAFYNPSLTNALALCIPFAVKTFFFPK
jgi:hypothetical protein